MNWSLLNQKEMDEGNPEGKASAESGVGVGRKVLWIRNPLVGHIQKGVSGEAPAEWFTAHTQKRPACNPEHQLTVYGEAVPVLVRVTKTPLVLNEHRIRAKEKAVTYWPQKAKLTFR